MKNMNLKKISLIIGLSTLSSSLMYSVNAQSAEFYDQVTVVASTPIYKDVVQPRQECWTEYVTENVPVNNHQEQGRSATGALIGTIAGGILGNQVGGGSGRTAATGIGMMVGGIVGDRLSMNNQPAQPTYVTQQRPIQKCRTINDSQRMMQGYNVTYTYNGRQFTERMPYDVGVGQQIPVTIKLGISRNHAPAPTPPSSPNLY